MKHITIKSSQGGLYKNAVQQRPAFVKFHKLDCGYCVQLIPEWNKLLKELKNKDITVIEVESSALNEIDIGDQIQGFPTLVEVKQGGIKGREYMGEKTKENMLKFIEEVFGSDKKRAKRTKRKNTKRKNTKRKNTKRKNIKRKNIKRKTKKV